MLISTTDWHPIDHVSFASAHPGKASGDSVNITFLDTATKIETQGLYANHCVPETWGAEIETGVQTRLHYLEGFRTPVNYIKKAQNHSVDSYSAFADNQYHQFTTLDSELSLHSIETIIITGLITNACVRGTSIDGIKLGYEVILIEDATETVSDEVKASAIAELEGWGMSTITQPLSCEVSELMISRCPSHELDRLGGSLSHVLEIEKVTRIMRNEIRNKVLVWSVMVTGS